MAESCVTALGTTACSSDSQQKLVLGPGAALLYIGPTFSFTFDVRYDIILSERRLHGLIFALGIGF
jgi:hypothetical protein